MQFRDHMILPRHYTSLSSLCRRVKGFLNTARHKVFTLHHGYTECISASDEIMPVTKIITVPVQ